MKKLIVANWKMHPDSAKNAVSLAAKIEKGIPKSNKAEVVIAPPFPFLEDVKKVLKNSKLGAQDVFFENKGAYTGEVSPSMLKSSGVEYVIIGHSENRKLGETDAIINKKIKATLKEGLKVILCVGEGLEIRKKGLSSAKNFVQAQLKKDIPTTNYKLPTTQLVVAYEPVWAISTNKNSKPDRPEDSAEMIKYIKQILHSKFYILNSRVVYGGSVNSRNAKNFLQYKEIDGALIGGASLKAEEFIKIINIK